jgi:hypothetical protein
VAEIERRDAAVAKAAGEDRALSSLIRTRAQQVKDEPPSFAIDRQQELDAIRDAETRQAWAKWHRAQAERHRATLTDLIAHHEAEAERLAGVGGGS